MTEAIFGLIGVFVGSAISWFQTYYTTKQTELKNAKYLAIRIVCILDKYMEDCVDVVKDDGLSYGQRAHDGFLKAQVKRPEPPVFPEDIDWKSIDQDLMYKILSFPSDIISANKIIDFTWTISSAPDFEDWFEERSFHYAQFGLYAYDLVKELSSKYNIKMKTYNDWNPVADLSQDLKLIVEKRQRRIQRHENFVKQADGQST